jgi:hypothetical protein
MEAVAREQLQASQLKGTPTLLVAGPALGLTLASVHLDWMLKFAYEAKSPAQPRGVTNQQSLL